MDLDTLQLFCRQLHFWAEEAISDGRFPFRRIETDHLLLTRAGVFRPPLTFWINRDSFMAGGVLFLPPRAAEESVETGRHCADALGLRHFVAWAAREIVIWEVRGREVVRCKTLCLPEWEEYATNDFRLALTSVMEELKVLSVLGAVPPPELSPYYLANLCRSALDAVLPCIEEAYRAARGEGRLEGQELARELAFSKGMLTLLRLLGLILHDCLPNTVQPEGLERAMQFALDTLPAALRAALQPTTREIPLPAEGAIRFHHLLRRLSQLQCGKDRQRASRALEILLTGDGARLGISPLPFAPGKTTGLTLLIPPEGLCPEREVIEVGSPPLLAHLALLRELRSLPPARLQKRDPFGVTPPAPLRAVRGTLSDRKIPTESERRLLTAHLRASWPTRRFLLPRRTPAWAWSFIHLLGLADDGASIELCLPDDWIFADFGERLSQLLTEEYTVHFLAPATDGMMLMRLVRGSDPQTVTTVAGPDGMREIGWQRLAEGHRVLLRLAMKLPATLFRLLEEGALKLPGEGPWPQNLEREIFLYTRSPLGAFLWNMVGGGRPLPGRRSLQADILRASLPLPAKRILTELGELPDEKTESLTLSVFDRELMRLIGAQIPLPTASAGKGRFHPTAGKGDARPASQELAEKITASVFVDGLPRFPEQYLYDHYRPQLKEYRFAGPLRICDEFFDRVRMCGPEGETLEVDGIEFARALQLASFGDRSTVSLPVERRLTGDILSRYLADLKALRRDLLRQCHQHLAEKGEANALADRIWDSLSLPPCGLIED